VACVFSLCSEDKEEIFFSQAIKIPVTHVPGADEKISVPADYRVFYLYSARSGWRRTFSISEILQTRQLVLNTLIFRGWV
jgi:hypothetical protein